MRISGLDIPFSSWAGEAEMDADSLSEKIINYVSENIKAKNANVPERLVHMVEKSILLQVLDQLWKDHIAALDQMRYTIVLRTYGQKDPLNEYKKEAFNMFSQMLDALCERLTFLICRAQIQMGDESTLQRQQETQNKNVREIHEEPQSAFSRADSSERVNVAEADKRSPFMYNKQDINPQDPNTWGKISRNDPCPCGSGLKYKHCHGKI